MTRQEKIDCMISSWSLEALEGKMIEEMILKGVMPLCLFPDIQLDVLYDLFISEDGYSFEDYLREANILTVEVARREKKITDYIDRANGAMGG